MQAVLADLAGAPFMAPEAGRLRELGLDGRAIGAAARAGLLLRVTEQIVLAPGAAAEAARALAGLPQPFTAAEARQALGTTRRVAIPLLEYLDRAGITQRLPDDRRRLRLGGDRREKVRSRVYRAALSDLRTDKRLGRPARCCPGGMQGVHQMTALDDAPAASAPAATGVDTSQDVALERATQWANEYAARLTERYQSNLAKQNGHSSGGLAPHIGEVTTGDPVTGFYVAFDVAVTSPIQFGGPPPYHPSKIIKAGESAFIIAFMFANPNVDILHGFAVPANVQLSNRHWRMTLDQLNLGTGAALTQQVVTSAFVGRAPVLTQVVFALPTLASPGPNPSLIEANVTVEITDPAQPYAAFATNFFDVDYDPSFLGIPSTSAGWRNELPNRYLLYSN